MVWIVEGVRYKSIREACKEYNVDYARVTRNIRLGMNLEEAIKKNPRNYFYSKGFEIDGVSFKTLKEACDFYEVNYYTVTNKIRQGIPIEEAIKNTKKKRNRVVWQVDDKVYSSLKEVCDDYNMIYSTVRTRLKSGMSLEDAVKTKRDIRAKKIKVSGRIYESLMEVCKVYDVEYNYVRYQMGKGLSAEEAIRVVKDRNSLFKI